MEFLFLERQSSAAIHKRLKNVYGDNTLNESIVRRWARRIKGGETAKGKAVLTDQPRSGRPAHAVFNINLKRTVELINRDRKIAATELSEALDISRGKADFGQ